MDSRKSIHLKTLEKAVQLNLQLPVQKEDGRERVVVIVQKPELNKIKQKKLKYE